MQLNYKGYDVCLVDGIWMVLDADRAPRDERLSVIKRWIDKANKQARDEAAVDAWLITGRHSGEIGLLPARIVEYVPDRANVDRVAVMSVERGKKKRSHMRFDDLTVGPLEKIDPIAGLITECNEQIAVLTAKRQALVGTIPRLTAEDIQPLIDLAKAKEAK